MSSNINSKRGRQQGGAAARLCVSDELGLLKLVEVPSGPNWSGAQVVQTWGRPDKNAGIHTLAAPNYLTSDANVLAASRVGGSIQLLDSLSGQQLCSLPPPKAPAPSAPSSNSNPRQAALDREVRCLAFRQERDSANSSAPLELVSSTVGGVLRVHKQPAQGLEQQQQQQEAEQTASGVQGNGSSSVVQTWDEATALHVAPNVECMALDPSQSLVAVGGEGCHLRVWSLNQGQEVFRAKGGKPSRCGLVDLPHLTAATFLPDPSNQLLTVGTVKHKLWLYDMRAGKRPQVDMEWGTARVTALAADPDGVRVWAANGIGRIEGIDLRARTMRGCCKGPAGSIRSIALHPRSSPHASAPSGPDTPTGSGSLQEGPPLLASAGLDRFLRVHSTGAGQAALSKVYLKQQLTGVVWLRPPVGQGATEQEGEDDEKENEQGEGAGGEEEAATGGVEQKGGAAAGQEAQGQAKQQKKEKKGEKKEGRKGKKQKKQ